MVLAFVGTETKFVSTTPTTTISLDTPSGAVVGDVLVAWLRTQSSSTTADYAAAGWTRISAAFVPSQSTARAMGMYMRMIPSAEALAALPAQTTFVRTDTGASSRQAGVMKILRGVDQTDPIGGFSPDYVGTLASATTRRIESFAIDSGFSDQLYVAMFAAEFTSGIDPTPTVVEAGFEKITDVVTPGAITTSRTGIVAYSKKVTAAQSVTMGWSSGPAGVGSQGVVFNGGPPPTPVEPTSLAVKVVETGGALADYELWEWNGTGGNAIDEVAVVQPGVKTVTEMFAKAQTTPIVFAHRLGSRNWPEHSMHGATQSLLRGVDALEFSVGKSSDGVLFGLHDETINRTSGTTGLPPAQQMTWAEISSYPVLASLTDDPTQPNRPYLKLDELRAAYPDVVLLLDPKYLGQTGAIAFFQNLKDTVPDATELFMLKYSFTATNLAIPIGAMGFKSWGYLYENDLASASFNTWAAPWTILGMDYNTSEAGWADFRDRMAATINPLTGQLGKKYTGHIAPTLAATVRPLAYGAIGNMVSGVKQVKGF